MTLKSSAEAGSRLKWVKSSYSSNDGPDCVEVAAMPGIVNVRDSKDPDGAQLAFTPQAWTAFVAYASQF